MKRPEILLSTIGPNPRHRINIYFVAGHEDNTQLCYWPFIGNLITLISQEVIRPELALFGLLGENYIVFKFSGKVFRDILISNN